MNRLLATAPSLKERSRKAKRVPGSSGRLHKCKNGMWEFSDDEFDSKTEEGIKAGYEKLEREPQEVQIIEKLDTDRLTSTVQVKLNLRIR